MEAEAAAEVEQLADAAAASDENEPAAVDAAVEVVETVAAEEAAEEAAAAETIEAIAETVAADEASAGGGRRGGRRGDRRRDHGGQHQGLTRHWSARPAGTRRVVSFSYRRTGHPIGILGRYAW